MQVLRHNHEVSVFIQSQPQSEISSLIQLRLDELLADGDAMDDLLFFVVMEAGDTLSELEAALVGPVFTADGHPLWEVIEAHDGCFEMVFVLSSSGYGALVFVPRQGPAPELLALCRTHATLVREPSTP